MMNKPQLIDLIAKKGNISKVEAKRAYELGTIYFDPRNKYLVLSFHYRSLYVIGLDGEVQEFFDYNEYLEL